MPVGSRSSSGTPRARRAGRMNWVGRQFEAFDMTEGCIVTVSAADAGTEQDYRRSAVLAFEVGIDADTQKGHFGYCSCRGAKSEWS